MGLKNKDKTQGTPNIENAQTKGAIFYLISPLVILGNLGIGISAIVDRLVLLYHLQKIRTTLIKYNEK